MLQFGILFKKIIRFFVLKMTLYLPNVNICHPVGIKFMCTGPTVAVCGHKVAEWNIFFRFYYLNWDLNCQSLH